MGGWGVGWAGLCVRSLLSASLPTAGAHHLDAVKPDRHRKELDYRFHVWPSALKEDRKTDVCVCVCGLESVFYLSSPKCSDKA